jgi:phosphohistidine phosphatase SixA
LIGACEAQIETMLVLGHNPSLLTFALDCDKNGYHEWIDEINHSFVPAEIIVLEFENASTWAEAMIDGGKIKDIFIPK